jgi:hypothetical protein
MNLHSISIAVATLLPPRQHRGGGVVEVIVAGPFALARHVIDQN